MMSLCQTKAREWSIFALGLILAGTLSATKMATAAEPNALRLPVTCAIGTDCFVQQLPDMDPGPEASDPFCGGATYDGHDGIDIRIRSLTDFDRHEPVVAALSGTVRGVRDGMADHLVETSQDRQSIAGRECGNGVVLTHPDGLETQYCHMRRGSIAVHRGEQVEAGQKLGEIGASGWVQFPHVHLSVRRAGQKVDPISGRDLTEGCVRSSTLATTLFDQKAAAALSGSKTQLLGFGMAGGPVDHDRLLEKGPPAAPDAGAPVTIAWSWFINLEAGDIIRTTITAPDGSSFFAADSAPMNRHKATYSSFAGKKRALQPGDWQVTVSLLRHGETVLEENRTIPVKAGGAAE
ncbi:M23 family metallopeptidase [Aurantimonas sp. VKM B-3413]|uniref:M23 family metallopeptidase n=1 Tax=Aurantimonas sp. VKM B-3413 TaxID=2779401 RepID=UPI001E5648B5|nr:M23 family metallopeptidase [Aurantimonas sp. VKM B-3413]MCB8839403.1 M23 family metallopeptidase [Aurantimonas sp. VKM B-3413]